MKQARHARPSPTRCPDLEQLHRQAKELLRAIHAGDSNAIAELREYHPEATDSSAAKLAETQLVLARPYGASSWTRLVDAVRLAEAIWRDVLGGVRELITQNAALIHDHVLIRTDSNWGPPRMYGLHTAPLRALQYQRLKCPAARFHCGSPTFAHACQRRRERRLASHAKVVHRSAVAPRRNAE
jgi:hypothetical protein